MMRTNREKILGDFGIFQPKLVIGRATGGGGGGPGARLQEFRGQGCYNGRVLTSIADKGNIGVRTGEALFQ